MAEKITIAAPDVWEYFQHHKRELKTSMREIASNNEYGIVIYITESCGFMSVVVTEDDTQIYEENIVNQYDCELTIRNIYNDYLTDKVINIICDTSTDGEETKIDIHDIISDREELLDEAVYGFVMAVMDDTYIDDDTLQDLKDHFLEYMFRKHDLDIYRPMILEDDNGNEFFEKYPYGCMVFDDEVNTTSR